MNYIQPVKYGIAQLSIIPIRREPAHPSEQVSQLLFGEIYEITGRKDVWLSIKCVYDGYMGWINENQHTEINEKDFAQLMSTDAGVSLELVSSASSSHRSVPVVAGSSLPFFDGMNFRLLKEKYIYNGQAVQAEARNPAMFERVALKYINAPYLWGGRSPFGIDCSGFTQIVYKSIGIKLPRDAYQQAEQGTLVNFIEEARAGDLAFFNNEEGKITHTGIVLKDGKIIHASGKVRIDKIDHFGIHNATLGKYTHQLKVIKRFF